MADTTTNKQEDTSKVAGQQNEHQTDEQKATAIKPAPTTEQDPKPATESAKNSK